MPRGYRYDPDGYSQGGPGSNWWESPDAVHALNDYGAAVRDMDPAERPPFALDDWRDSNAQPTTPDWASDEPPAPEPVCQCGDPQCPGVYGGRCAYSHDPYNPGSYY
jgi:hypothetical protein